MIEINRPNLFQEHAKKLAISELKEMVLENIKTISMERFSYLDYVPAGPLSLSLKSYRFIPKNQKMTEKMSHHTGNLKDFFDFLGMEISTLVHVKLDEKKTFTSYLLSRYTALDFQLRGDNLAFHPSQKYLLESARKSLVVALHGFVLASGLAVDLSCYFTYQFTFMNDQVLELMELDKYTPLKSIIGLGKSKLSKSKICKKLNENEVMFFRGCLYMEPSELIDFSTKIECILSSKRSRDTFLFELLENRHFSFMQAKLLGKLLRQKKPLEDEWAFTERAQGVIIDRVFNHFISTIDELKTHLDHEELIKKFVKEVYMEGKIERYSPFIEIFSFVPVFDSCRDWYCKFPVLPIPNLNFNQIAQFVTNVLLKVDDIRKIDFNASQGRLILVKSAEFLILDPNCKIDLDQKKWNAWFIFFLDEVTQIPSIYSKVKNLIK